jgi:hypothetical protein
MHTPPSTRRNASQLLDVHLDELAGTGVLDAATNHGPGRPIHPGDAVQALTAQDAMHRRCRQPHDAGNASRPKLATTTQHLDPTFQRPRCSSRTRPWLARAIEETDVAFATPTAPPLVGSLPRDPQLVRHVRNRAARLNPSDQQPSTMQVQPSVSVHKSLPRVGAGFSTHTLPRRLFSSADHRRVNNVHGQDN